MLPNANRQCRIKASAIDAAALGPFKKYARGRGREKEQSSLFWLRFLWLIQFRKKIVKIVAHRCHILKQK